MRCYLSTYLNLPVIYFHFVLTYDRSLFTKMVQEGYILGVPGLVKRYVSVCGSICAFIDIYLVPYFCLWPSQIGYIFRCTLKLMKFKLPLLLVGVCVLGSTLSLGN